MTTTAWGYQGSAANYKLLRETYFMAAKEYPFMYMGSQSLATGLLPLRIQAVIIGAGKLRTGESTV